MAARLAQRRQPADAAVYAAGITILQVLWLCLLVLPEPAAQIAWWR